MRPSLVQQQALHQILQQGCHREVIARWSTRTPIILQTKAVSDSPQQTHLNLVALVGDFHVFVHFPLLVVVAEGVLRRIWPRVVLGLRVCGEGMESVLVLAARDVVMRIVLVVPSVNVGLRVPVV